MSIKDQQFESLVKSFYQPLYRYAFWKTRSSSLAEDLVQETFTRAWKNLEQLKDFKSAKPWLFTILNRENARRFDRKPLPIIQVEQDWQLEQVADPKDDIQTMLIRRAIFALPEQFREPLAMQVIGGLSTDEIGHALGITQNTVSTRLFRARAELKRQISETKTEGASHSG